MTEHYGQEKAASFCPGPKKALANLQLGFLHEKAAAEKSKNYYFSN